MKKALTIAAMFFVAVLNASAGWYYESTIVVTGNRPEQAAMMNSKTKARVDSSSIRTDFVESGNPMMRAGTYMISTDGGKTLKLVDPEAKTYSVMDLSALSGMFSGSMMKIVNPKFEKISEEDGGKLLGHSVRRIKFKMSHTIEMNLFGMKNTTTSETTHEVWAAPGIKEGGTGFWSGKQTFVTGDKNFDQIVASEMTRIEGMPLKHVMNSRSVDAMGQTNDSVMTTTVTTVREERVSASTFEIPSDFTEVPMMAAAAAGAGKGSGGGASGKPGAGFDPAKLQELMKQFKTPPAN